MSDARADAPLYACLYQPPAPGTVSYEGERDLAPGGRITASAMPDRRRAVEPAGAPVSPLLAIAADFSPRYEQHRADLVSLDLRGLGRLFGTPRAIGEELRLQSIARGCRLHIAVAPTRTAALVLAVARAGLTVVSATDQAAVLASVSLGILEQLGEDPRPAAGSATQLRIQAEEARAAIAALRRWGLRTLGELAALPAADLSARLGRGGRIWQALARGEELRPLVPLQEEERFESTMELEWPVEGHEPLSFVLTRLLEPLSTRLERRDRGAAVLHVVLRLVTRDLHACRLELPSPLRDVRTLRTLALLDLEARPPAAAIEQVTVAIEPTPGRILQHALFTRPHPTPEQLSTLLARLGAVMGQDRVGAPALVDAHRPGAFALVSFATEHPELPPDVAAAEVEVSSAALRRCRQPVPARVAVDAQARPVRVFTDRRGFAGGAVVQCAGPWRTSGAWWEGTDTTVRPFRADSGPWSRDEWEVALDDGAVYRIFRDRTTEGWFIDAIVD